MFMELLIVLGIMGILAVIVIVAINPVKHLCEAANTRRNVTTRELTNALNQYQIRTRTRAGGGSIPVGEANATPICRLGVTNDATCINLDVLVPDYLADLPVDQAETNANYTGYGIYQMLGGLDLVTAIHLESCSS